MYGEVLRHLTRYGWLAPPSCVALNLYQWGTPTKSLVATTVNLYKLVCGLGPGVL